MIPSGKRRRNSSGIIRSSVISVLSGPQLPISSAPDGPVLRPLFPQSDTNNWPRMEFSVTGRTNLGPHPIPSGSMSLGNFLPTPIQTKSVASLPSFGCLRFLVLKSSSLPAPPKTKDIVYKGYKRAGQRTGMKGVLKDWSPETRLGSREGGRSSPSTVGPGTSESPVDSSPIIYCDPKNSDRNPPETFHKSGCGGSSAGTAILSGPRP